MSCLAATVDPDKFVVDIGGSKVPERLVQTLRRKLTAKDKSGRYWLPEICFSDDVGLRMWPTINRLPDYYQTSDEIELLQVHLEKIIQYFPDGCSIIDMGCGDVRKVKMILDKLEEIGREVTYYGLDLSLVTVTASIQELRRSYKHVRCHGLWGTFENAFEWSRTIEGRRTFLTLGSTFGGDRFDRGVKYFKIWRDTLRKGDYYLLGVDGNRDVCSVWKSYHDPQGAFEEFIRNGFRYSNKVLGVDWYVDEDWEVSGFIEEKPLNHRFFLRALREVSVPSAGIYFPAGERIECYEGWKNGPGLVRKQLELAGLREAACFEAPSKITYEYVVELS